MLLQDVLALCCDLKYFICVLHAPADAVMSMFLFPHAEHLGSICPKAHASALTVLC